MASQGHLTIEAADGDAALIAASAHCPDLVITDVLMPVMDGYELVRQLRLRPATRMIPVVFYTAHYGEREARALALSSGVACVLPKPAEAEAVLAVVARALTVDGASPAERDPLSGIFDREHLRLLTDKLSEKVGDLRATNARLRALINIGLELASERDPERLLHNVCVSARDLFGASYITLGLVGRLDRTVERVITYGTQAVEWIVKGAAVPGILGTVVAERRAVRGRNPGGDPAGLLLPVRHPLVAEYIAAPIASPAHVYGWICFVGNEGRAFSDGDQPLVNALAGLIGRIYENGYFAAAAQQRAVELEREVLERRNVEAALRGERDRSRQYLDAADVILLALDLNGRIVLINRKGCEITGWPEHELIGREWATVCLPDRVRPAVAASLRGVVAGVMATVENAVLTRSGEERVIEWRNGVLRNDVGEIVGTLSSGADVTDRRRAAEATREAEERTRFAFEAASVGIWDIDYTTGVVRCSDILEAQYGFQPGTFGGTLEAFLERVHPDDRAELATTLGHATATGADFQVQHRAVWPDGSVRWLTGAGRVRLDQEGRAARGVGISLDVTARRVLEAHYQQAQKMEAVGRLAGGIAHDFNNLLTVILGNSELLLDQLEAGDPRRADVEEIQKASASAAGLTRQLLAFSRKQIIEPTVFDLNVVMTGMRALIARLVREDVSVVFTLGADLAPIKADRGQVEQILMNLAANARDAMPGVGTLTIQTANVEFSATDPQPYPAALPAAYVVLTVTDTGTGMTPEVQKRLFEPFFTTKDPGRGTGIGLATVHGIATASGGGVTVDSAMGIGTTFRVYFPKAEAAVVAVEPPSTVVSPRVGAETLLLVDDVDGLRMLTRRLLQQLGYLVLSAASAEEALELFGQAKVDVVLTDVVMPGGSGPELVSKLRAISPALKVIYMSGYAEEAIVRDGVIMPGIAFLHKPFSSESLGRKVREALDSEPPTAMQ